MNESVPSVAQHFVDKEAVVRATYDRLLDTVRQFGEFTEDPKKSSIHLNRRTAFAGVATRKESLILTLKAAGDIESPRVRKHEKASANRWHLEIQLTTPDDIDSALKSWLK